MARARLFERGGARPGAHALLERMRTEYEDVLQNIEFVLIKGYQEDGSVDDAIVAEALLGVLRGEIPTGTRSGTLAEMLCKMRRMRCDIPDNVWRDCLRTVLQSVRRHSSGRRGDCGYLHFVERFIRCAKSS